MNEPRGRHRGRQGRLGRRTPTGRSRARQHDRRLPAGHARRRGRARSALQLGRRDRHARRSPTRRPERDHDDQHARPARRPTGACSSRRRSSTTCASRARRSIDIQASLEQDADATSARSSSTTAPATQVTRNGDGISTDTDAAERTRTLLGRRRTRRDDSACYLEVTKPHARTSTQWRVSQGHPRLLEPRLAVRDRRRRSTLGQKYRVHVPDAADGLHVPGRPPDRRSCSVGQLLGATARRPARRGAAVTLDTKRQQGHAADRRRLRGAAAAAGALAAETVAPVLGAVPADITVDDDERRRHDGRPTRCRPRPTTRTRPRP